jgi:hypothetical protein
MVRAKQPVVMAQAERGQRMRSEPIQNFRRAEQLLEALQRFAELCRAHDAIFVASGIRPSQRSAVAANAQMVGEWLDVFVSNLPFNSKLQ